MSASAIYIGDEVSAAGYRLAGVETIVPGPGEEAAASGAALERATLVILSAGVAARLPQAMLHAAQARVRPLVLVVPDRTGGAATPDIAQALRRQLGLEP